MSNYIPRAPRYPERQAYIVEEVESGRAMASIAAELGITRERVRQIYRAASGKGSPLRARSLEWKSLALLATIRGDPSVTTITAAVTEAGMGRRQSWDAYSLLGSLGKRESVERLLRIRRRRSVRHRIISTLRRVARERGRNPRLMDFYGTEGMGFQGFYRYFGSFNAALRAAGLPVNRERWPSAKG